VLTNQKYILRSYITRMVVNSHTKPASGDKIRGKSVTSKRSFQCTKKLKTLAHFQTQMKQPSDKNTVWLMFTVASLQFAIPGSNRYIFYLELGNSDAILCVFRTHGVSWFLHPVTCYSQQTVQTIIWAIPMKCRPLVVF